MNTADGAVYYPAGRTIAFASSSGRRAHCSASSVSPSARYSRR